MGDADDRTARQFPKLRWPLDFRFEKVQQQEVLILRCPLGITPQPLLLVPAVAPILACFEGQQSVESIAQKFSANGVTPALVEQLAQLLDERLFLATPRFRQAQQELYEAFYRLDTRPPALAGSAYPAEPERLRGEIEQMLAGRTSMVIQPDSDLLAVVVPHIDYRRGHACYGTSYAAVRGATHHITVLIGTSHQYSDQLFHLTRKKFASPLGVMPAAGSFIDRLVIAFGSERSYRDEILHRQEHSLELQLPFLSCIGFEQPIVPVLVGGFHRFLQAGKYPDEDEEYATFVESFCSVARETLAAGQRICFVAGVDMAHVGRAFGDTVPLSPAKMERIAERDRAYLRCLTEGDPHALFAHVAEDGDARRICGFPTMYTLLDIWQRLGLRYRAELLDYRQAVDYQADCAVTFAGMAMYR